MPTLYIIAYGIGYLAMYPAIFRFLVNDLSMGRKPDKEDVLSSGLMAANISFVWPLIVIYKILDYLVFDPIIQHVRNQYDD